MMMIDQLTEDERAEVREELERLRGALLELQAVESVSPEASVRRTATIGRLAGEIQRLERLLGPVPAPGEVWIDDVGAWVKISG